MFLILGSYGTFNRVIRKISQTVSLIESVRFFILAWFSTDRTVRFIEIFENYKKIEFLMNSTKMTFFMKIRYGINE